MKMFQSSVRINVGPNDFNVYRDLSPERGFNPP